MTWEMMTTYVVMNNIIIDDKRDEGIHNQEWEFQGELVARHLGAATFEEFLHVHEEIRDRATHDQLQKDLIKHQWALAGRIIPGDE
jgi:hypothetical protein